MKSHGTACAEGRVVGNRGRLGCALLLLATLIGYAGARLTARPAARHSWFSPSDRRLVLAHQGGEGLFPCDTLEAFRGSLALGVDVLDLDIHLSQDRQLMVIHDDTVDRTTNATGRVCQQSAAQLQRYDAGYRFSRDGGRSFPFRGRGVRIPRLEEVLDLEPRVRVGIEIKPDDPEVARALAELLRRRGEAQRVLVASFHHRVLTAFRQACSEAATSASPWETRQFLVLAMFGQEALFSPAFQALQIPEEHKGRRLLTPSLVAAAHRRGLKVIPWTINQEADMRRLLGWGVDGLNTDYPDRLLKVLPPALR